ncbi:hypothetical protein ACP70R_008312 [Stipagrostis hirtigluma subsp. patula]
MEKWPELLQDILRRIFATLEIPDLVRAGSVCSSWRAAFTSLCSTPCRLQQTPCLLYTSKSAGAMAVGLYSLAEEKAYTLTLPDPPIRHRHIIGSSYGWIITADESSELHLVNPITSEQIALPSITTIEQVKSIFDEEGDICNYTYSWCTGELMISDTPTTFDLSQLRDFLFYKAFLSSDPSMEDYFVVLIHNPRAQLSFARAGDDRWTWLPSHNCYDDCLFRGGLLYACTTLGEIHEFDLVHPAVTRKIFLGKVEDMNCERIYIVQAPCGELLQIWRSNFPPQGYEYDGYDSDPNDPVYHTSFKVHKVEPTSKTLVEMSSLGGKFYFLGITDHFASVLQNTRS